MVNNRLYNGDHYNRLLVGNKGDRNTYGNNVRWVRKNNRGVVKILGTLLFGLFSLCLTVQPLSADEQNIGHLSDLQQQSLMLKMTLENAKLQKELTQLSNVKAVSNNICNQKGVSNLTLDVIYGVKKQRFATFSYNNATQIDAKVGDSLLCNEKVTHISLDKVEVTKDGKRYVVAGTVTAVPSVPLQTIPSSYFR